jgi:hypothetical protein
MCAVGKLAAIARRYVLDAPSIHIFLTHSFSALTFVLAPLPNALFSHCGSDEFAANYDGASSGPVDLGRFITAMIVTSGFALPIVLAHAQIIHNTACVMSILGGGCVRRSATHAADLLESYSLVYGTILAYSAAFNQEESEFD